MFKIQYIYSVSSSVFFIDEMIFFLISCHYFSQCNLEFIIGRIDHWSCRCLFQIFCNEKSVYQLNSKYVNISKKLCFKCFLRDNSGKPRNSLSGGSDLNPHRNTLTDTNLRKLFSQNLKWNPNTRPRSTTLLLFSSHILWVIWCGVPNYVQNPKQIMIAAFLNWSYLHSL